MITELAKIFDCRKFQPAIYNTCQSGRVRTTERALRGGQFCHCEEPAKRVAYLQCSSKRIA